MAEKTRQCKVTMNNITIMRKVVSSKDYNANRLKRMSAEAIYYSDLAVKAPNAVLRSCYFAVSDMYNKRYLWYFRKMR